MTEWPFSDPEPASRLSSHPLAPLFPLRQGEPVPQDCGQPTHFDTRRQRFLFSVKVPADWPKDRKLLWTIKFRGATESAKGWLVPEYEIDYGVISENGPGGILEAGNTPPKVVTTNVPQTITLPEKATVSADVTDDGLPKPRPERSNQAAVLPNQNQNIDPARAAELAAARTPGIRVRWIVYRGPAGAKVTFDPERTTPVYGKPVTATTKATFTFPAGASGEGVAVDEKGDIFGQVHAGPQSSVLVLGTADSHFPQQPRLCEPPVAHHRVG